MKRPEAIRQRFLLWVLIFGLWCLLVISFAGQMVFTSTMPWPQAFRVSLRDWLPLVVLSPIAVWLATQFPLERGKLRFSIPIHLGACVLAAALQAVVAAQWIPEQPAGGPGGRRQFGFRGGGGPPPGPDFDRDRDRGAPESPQPVRPGFLVMQQQRRAFVALRSALNLPLYCILVGLVHTLNYYRRSQERQADLEARLAEAKLQALRMQLHPHFLFNTLNAITTLLHKDPRAADEMIGDLSELLRATLDTAEQEIPLRRELEFLGHYLDIQQARFGDRLRVDQELDANALDGLVPTLILQPLVENAVRHGIEPSPTAGSLLIRARRDQDVLRLAIRDSGSGPKVHARDQPGIGVANTTARLKELYGDKARLTLTRPAEGGFCVQLEIPFHQQPVSPPAPTETEAHP